MRNLDSCRRWRCMLCPCNVTHKFFIHFWNRTILLCMPCILRVNDWHYVSLSRVHKELIKPKTTLQISSVADFQCAYVRRLSTVYRYGNGRSRLGGLIMGRWQGRTRTVASEFQTVLCPNDKRVWPNFMCKLSGRKTNHTTLETNKTCMVHQ
jgi:hypothetical protein